ncbi:MAG: hypothetical protein ACREA0_24995 [bacterium]
MLAPGDSGRLVVEAGEAVQPTWALEESPLRPTMPAMTRPHCGAPDRQGRRSEALHWELVKDIQHAEVLDSGHNPLRRRKPRAKLFGFAVCAV